MKLPSGWVFIPTYEVDKLTINVSIEQRELIMCKECKHSELEYPDFPNQYYCDWHDIYNEGEHWCSDGDREKG